jgi:hypothetical protein
MSIHATKELKAYWKENLVIISVLLTIWFVVSYVCGILIANQLDAYTDRRFPPRLLVRQPGLAGDLCSPDLGLCLADGQAGHQVWRAARLIPVLTFATTLFLKFDEVTKHDILQWTWILTGLSFAVYIYVAYCVEGENNRRFLCRREVGSAFA